MRSTLIALATAGLLASGAAAAGTTTIQVTRNVGSAAVVPVQYSDRWDDRSANVNEREARVKARIDRGVHDGRITSREARRLYRELAAIEAKERAFTADGRLSYREDAELKSNLDRLAENVRVQLRDNERYSYYAR